jgi:hypothetical protein
MYPPRHGTSTSIVGRYKDVFVPSGFPVCSLLPAFCTQCPLRLAFRGSQFNTKMLFSSLALIAVAAASVSSSILSGPRRPIQHDAP